MSDDVRVTCHCGVQTTPADLLEHLRLMHPEDFGELETWPDGSLVIHDTTLTPDDFGGATPDAT